jgi:large subunit ribosomal protein L15
MGILDQLNKETGKKKKRIGRGPGSGHGKTSCRGHKGDGSRSGYKRRLGKEGGRLPLYMKLPTRGFTRGKFLKRPFVITLQYIEQNFKEGDLVSIQTLLEKGLVSKKEAKWGLKILSTGEITKKVTIEAKKLSKETVVKLEKASISYKII